jgi:hypothetical protein
VLGIAWLVCFAFGRTMAKMIDCHVYTGFAVLDTAFALYCTADRHVCRINYKS